MLLINQVKKNLDFFFRDHHENARLNYSLFRNF
jgi:hypothetical protein